jgi:hypothetical protein
MALESRMRLTSHVRFGGGPLEKGLFTGTSLAAYPTSSPVRREAARKRTSQRLVPRCAADPSAWLHAFRRLRTRYERRADIHLGLLQLACALICHRRLAQPL